jgi:glycosyltransferase involved in cell wall biosynthesis
MNKKYPKISIVTACYNHKDYIAETIESIISQGYPNLEYIVIDDGSSDGSWDIIKKYKDKVTICEKLDGYRDTPTIALNHGLQKATGDIIGWLNSDDVLLPNSLFTIADFFSKNKKEQWVTGIATTINSESQLVGAKMRLKSKFDFLIGDWKVIQQESTFWTRKLWDKVGGELNGEKKWAFDTELWTRFFENADHAHLTASFGAFRKGKQSKSVSDKDSFLLPNNHYLKEMKKRSSFKDKIFALIYRIIRMFSYVLQLVPHKIYSKLPILNVFSYVLYEYNFEKNSWKRNLINPFRAIK